MAEVVLPDGRSLNRELVRARLAGWYSVSGSWTALALALALAYVVDDVFRDLDLSRAEVIGFQLSASNSLSRGWSANSVPTIEKTAPVTLLFLARAA